MLDGAYIFRSPGFVAGFFDTLFGGLFFVKGIPLLAILATLVLVIASLLLATAESVTGNARLGRLARAFAIVYFSLLALFCLSPWDELFINLRHALHFAENNTFSFNRLTRLEGTVDFLPYFLVGCLAKLGLPVVELGFLMSFAGGLGAITACRALLCDLGLERHRTWATCALALFPPIVFNASNGFTASVFAATALWSIHFLFFSDRRAVGYALLAVLPLVRIEGGLLVALCGAARARRAGARDELRLTVAALVPAAVLSAWRWRYFGDPLPIPIHYKSSLGNAFFLLVGIRNFVADAVAGGALSAGAAIALCALAARRHGIAIARSLRQALVPLTLLLAFVTPYYLSGGDWFPSYWGRYFLPLTLFATVVGAAFVASVLPRIPAGERAPWTLAIVAVVGLPMLWPISSAAKFHEAVFTHRRILAKVFDKKTGRGHYRIQNLSQLGNHLRATTRPEDVIASSEVATIMFYARRETLDMLGVANPEIARAPLRAAPPLFRRFPVESELPFLIFKRIKPGILERERPAVVYTFDFLLRDLREELPFEEFTDADILRALGRWHFNLKGLIDPLYGGLAEIRRAGYSPVVVLYANAFCAMYFVSREALPSHLALLRKAGLAGGWRERWRDASDGGEKEHGSRRGDEH